MKKANNPMEKWTKYINAFNNRGNMNKKLEFEKRLNHINNQRNAYLDHNTKVLRGRG